MGVNKASVMSILTGALLCGLIWMTISALTDGSKAATVGGGWACFVAAAVIGFIAHAVATRGKTA